MKKTFNTLNTVTCAMLCAVAVVLASAFHHLGGQTMATLFSPMHFPVLLIGILCGQWYGLIGGVLAPVVGFLSSGRPPFPNGLIPMVCELATYGFLSGLLRRVFLSNPRTIKFSALLALVISMVAGRLINALVGAIVLSVGGEAFGATFVAKLAGNFTTTWAGIVLQLVLIPAILFALRRSGVLVKYLPDNSVTEQ